MFKQLGRSAGELGSGPEYEGAVVELVSTAEDSLSGDVTAATVVDTAYDRVRVVMLPLLVNVSHDVL